MAFKRIVKRAGLTPSPRPFHNLRASRETELVNAYPVQVVTSWLGNTPRVALRHYLMVRKEDFEKAVAAPMKKQRKVMAQQPHANLGSGCSRA